MIPYRIDRYNYPSVLSKEHILEMILHSEEYQIRRYLKALRMEEYHMDLDHRFRMFWWRGIKNRRGRKLGFIIHPGNFGEGLKIWHYGSVIVNPEARIGRNCQIHGNCCIGNTGGESQASPVIGDNVDIGQGAQILGGISIADNVKIGAGAVVVKTVDIPGATVVGIPGRIIETH